jgi:hypothetical protein
MDMDIMRAVATVDANMHIHALSVQSPRTLAKHDISYLREPALVYRLMAHRWSVQ